MSNLFKQLLRKSHWKIWSCKCCYSSTRCCSGV